MTKYTIEQQCWHGWDVFGWAFDDDTGEETPATYDTRTEAQAALDEFFEMTDGDYDPDEFRIVEAAR